MRAFRSCAAEAQHNVQRFCSVTPQMRLKWPDMAITLKDAPLLGKPTWAWHVQVLCNYGFMAVPQDTARTSVTSDA